MDAKLGEAMNGEEKAREPLIVGANDEEDGVEGVVGRSPPILERRGPNTARFANTADKDGVLVRNSSFTSSPTFPSIVFPRVGRF